MTPRILRTEQVEQVSQFAVRGPIFDLTGDPAVERDACRYLDDGVMIIENGRIKDVAAADQCLSSISASMVVHEYPDCLICPGFIDAHIHYAQTRIVGCPATGLLEWLETHTFPEELRFASADYSGEVAREFLDTLLQNGTTSALVYPTVHAISAEQFFQQAQGLNMRMIAGKVLMDRNAPPGLCDGDDHGLSETENQINAWHGSGRIGYAVTLRFAGTSTVGQMAACQKLVERYPEVLFHTHLSETKAEIEWTLGLFPEFYDYLAVYEGYGMVTDHSIFAHCIHLTDSECERLMDFRRGNFDVSDFQPVSGQWTGEAEPSDGLSPAAFTRHRRWRRHQFFHAADHAGIVQSRPERRGQPERVRSFLSRYARWR